jgi:CRISPR-associated endonuclease/helicase Cas3
MAKYYAHSGKVGIIPQLYHAHVRNVIKLSSQNMNKLLENTCLNENNQKFLIDVVRLASEYHDIGKLDSLTQDVLCQVDPDPTRLINHVDAGVACLVKKFNETNHSAYLVAAFFILCHHIGLQNWFEFIHRDKPSGFMSKFKYSIKGGIRCKYNIQEEYGIPINKTLESYTDEMLTDYLAIHRKNIPGNYVIQSESRGPLESLTALQLRLAFSCLIDADHQDTANHFSDKKYGGKFSTLKPRQRLKKMDKSIAKLVAEKVTSNVRRDMRTRLYDYAKNAMPNHDYYLLDATVGNAKTSAAIRLALKIAATRNQSRIYSIAPFTNIIDQTVAFYRKHITLPKEKKHNINEIHSKVEFEYAPLRMHNSLWNAPINVTTAVQFIESLVKHRTSSIKKLHLFANSVIIFDEYDNFIPHQLWNYVLEIMRDLVQNFNTVFIFSSGSSVHYWDLYDKRDIDVCEVVPTSVYAEMIASETKRVKIIPLDKPFDSIKEFYSHVMNSIVESNYKSAMIVLNTIQNSIVLTKYFEGMNSGFKIYHLSSYITPFDRKRKLDEVKKALENNEKIILIATSIVECGVDMSFQLGYREKSSLSSVLQFDGRINREHLHDGSSTYMFDFSRDLIKDKTFTENPMLSVGRTVLGQLDKSQITPEYCTDAIAMEIAEANRIDNSEHFLDAEINKRYKFIGESFRVINANTITLIVNPSIIKDIKDKKYVSFRRIMQHSVQIWNSKAEDIRFAPYIEEITAGEKEHYIWNGPYDPVYGIGSVI